MEARCKSKLIFCPEHRTLYIYFFFHINALTNEDQHLNCKYPLSQQVSQYTFQQNPDHKI